MKTAPKLVLVMSLCLGIPALVASIDVAAEAKDRPSVQPVDTTDDAPAEQGGYPAVRVVNSTQFQVTGQVQYSLCSSDNFDLAPGASVSINRGFCLLTKITATVSDGGDPAAARSYDSSGTSYSQYAIILRGPDDFAVTRIVTAEDEAEPLTCKQFDVDNDGGVATPDLLMLLSNWGNCP